jgi:hypothetical protein
MDRGACQEDVMRASPPPRRSIGSLLAAVIAIAALAGPAAGAERTVRYVDDDGTAATAGCDGTRTVPRRIQAVLDSAKPGDVIRVCPGAYEEQLSVTTPDLRIRSVRPWQAVVRTPATLSGDRPALLDITADGVQVQWLRLLARTEAPCEPLDAVVRVGGAREVLLRSLRIAQVMGGDSRFGPCGLATGVRVDGAASATILYTAIRGFQREGIASSPRSRVDVRTTSVRFFHPDSVVCAAACVRGAGVPYQSEIGIRLRGAGSVTDSNVIGQPEDSNQPLVLGVGIRLDGSARAQGNLISVAALGILLTGPGRVVENRVELAAAGLTGIEIRGAGAVVRRNVVGDTLVYGIAAAAGSHDNVIRDNEVYETYDAGCYDATGNVVPAGDSADPIDNTWTGNVSYTSQPVGLCTPRLG